MRGTVVLADCSKDHCCRSWYFSAHLPERRRLLSGLSLEVGRSSAMGQSAFQISLQCQASRDAS